MIQHLPKLYQSFCSAGNCLGDFWVTHQILLRKILFCLFILALLFGLYWIHERRKEIQFAQAMQGMILDAEAMFMNAQYENAQQLYEQAHQQIHEPITLAFLTTRLALSKSLQQFKAAIYQGNLDEVDRWQSGNYALPDEASAAIFEAHCQNFSRQIEKLRQYQKNAVEILRLLKQGMMTEADVLLQQNLQMAKRVEKSLAPLRNEMLKGIADGYPGMLLLSWKYKDALQLQQSDFVQAIGKDSAAKQSNAEKLLAQHQLEIAQILVQLLSSQEKYSLSQYCLAGLETFPKDVQLQRMEIAIQFNPCMSDAYQQKANLLRQAKKYADAQLNYENARTTYQAQMLQEQGWCALESRNLPEAISAWNKAIISWPKLNEAHHSLALIYFALGHTSKAIEHTDAILPQDRVGTTSEWIKLWASGQGSAEARPETSQISGLAKAYLLLGYATMLQQSGKYEQSLAILSECETLWTSENIMPWEVLLRKALVYEQMGDSNKAQESIGPLSQSSEPLAIFCYCLYLQRKEQLQISQIQQLPEAWQTLWQTWTSSNAIQPTKG